MTVIFLTPEQRKALKARQIAAAPALNLSAQPPQLLYLSVMFGAANKAVFFSKKIKDWDPAKHPKGAKGLFIDTPDKVQAKELKPNDVIVTKNGKPFKVEKPTAKGVKVNPLDPVTGEQKNGYTVLMHDVQVAKVESAHGAGSIHSVQDVTPGTFVKTKNGKKFKVSKHGKWTTVYPVDDSGKVTGKHTVLQPGVKVTIAPEDETGQVDKKLHDTVESVLQQLHAEPEPAKAPTGWPENPLDWVGLYIKDETGSLAKITDVDEDAGVFNVVPLVQSKGELVEGGDGFADTAGWLKHYFTPIGKEKPQSAAEKKAAAEIEKLKAKALKAADAWLGEMGLQVGPNTWSDVVAAFEDRLTDEAYQQWLAPNKTKDDHQFVISTAMGLAVKDVVGLEPLQVTNLENDILGAMQEPDDEAPVSKFLGAFDTLSDLGGGHAPGQVWVDQYGSQWQILSLNDDGTLDVQGMETSPGQTEPSTTPMADSFHASQDPTLFVTNLTPWIGAKSGGDKPQDEIQAEVAIAMTAVIAKYTGFDEVGDAQTLEQDVKLAMGMDQGAHDASQITAGSMPGNGTSFVTAFADTATGEELLDMYSPSELDAFQNVVKGAFEQAKLQAEVTPPATPTTVAQAVQEQLPAKLPKVPKVYSAGVGKDTRVVIEAVSDAVHHHEFKDSETFVVRRVGADGGIVDVIGSAHNMTAARKLARGASADHERIEEVLRASDVSTFHNIQYKTGQLVVMPNGRLFQVVDADTAPVTNSYTGKQEPANKLTLKKVWFDDAGNRVYDQSGHYTTGTAADYAIPVTASDEQVFKQLLKNGPPSPTNSFSWHASALAPKSLYHQEGLRGHLFSTKQTQVLRKERPGKYNQYLHADWSPDALVGKQTNEALKVMSALGYREIKPRQSDVVRVINAHGKRVHMYREGNKVTSVEEIKAPTIGVDGTPRQLYEQLKATLESGGDIAPLDPRNSSVPEVRTCHVRTHIFDLAMGHQNGVAAKIGKGGKGQKVKTDAQYAQEIEADHAIESMDAYLTKVERPPYAVLNYRSASREQFPDAEWELTPEAKYETQADLNAYEAAALAAILKRKGVAKLIGQQGDPIHEGDYVEGLKASDPVEGARKLAVEWKKAQGTEKEPSLLDQLPDESRNYVNEQMAKWLPLAAEHIKSRQTEWTARASNKRESDLKDEIAKRRKAEGTVPEATQAGEWGLPTWDEIELKPQTSADIDQLVAAIGDTPVDVPAFYSGGMVRDSVLQHKATETWGQVEQEFDEKLTNLLTQRGAIQETNRRSIDPGYAGSAKMYDGIQYTLADAGTDYEPSSAAVRAAIQRAFNEAEYGHQVDAMLKQAPEPESVGAVASAWHGHLQHQGFTVSQAEGLAFADADDLVKNPGLAVKLDDVTVTILSAILLDKIGVHSEKQTADMALKLKGAMSHDVKDAPEAAFEVENLAEAWTAANWGDTPSPGTVNQSRSQVWQALEQFATMKGGGAKRIEYVPHSQAAWNAGGAPTNQRGRLTLVGYTPSEAAAKLQELGVVGDLEDEVPFETILRSPRRHGRLVPLHPAYLRGDAELPEAPGRITHGLTASNHDALENMKRILASGGLLSIHERHRVGIKVTTASPAGDIRSGIDHAVFTTVGGGGAVGSGAAVSIIMKPDAFLRRDVVLAPHDFGGADTRYPQYKSYLNQLQGQVGEDKTNLYAPISPKVRQRHLNQISIHDSNEYNLGPTVPIEDWDQIVVGSQAAKDQIEDRLNELLLLGKIAAKPEVVVGGGYGVTGSKANTPLGQGEVEHPF